MRIKVLIKAESYIAPMPESYIVARQAIPCRLASANQLPIGFVWLFGLVALGLLVGAGQLLVGGGGAWLGAAF